MKEFADDIFKFVENGKKLSKQEENTVGKGEIARYEQFLLFPQFFQKMCPADTWKPGLVWERVNNIFPWSNNVFEGLFLPSIALLFTTPFRLLTTLRNKSFESIFSVSHSVFYPIKERNHHFKMFFAVCKCFKF